MATKYKAAIFDMDGTILDTIEDLKDSLNHSLSRFGHRGDFTSEETCRFFGSGARTAVMRALLAESGASNEMIGLAGTPDAPELPISDSEVVEILRYYKPWYAAHCAIKTGPFPGIPELLRTLAKAGLATAVVSNKPDDAVQSLCEEYFPNLFDYAIGESAGIRRKPSPDMVWAALSSLGVRPEESVYIGDSEVDIQTAKNAGLACICVDWGFRSREVLVQNGAEMIVSSCDELMKRILE